MKVIGICGISGSGKSFLIDELANQLNIPVTIISMDNYYKPIEFQGKDENGVVNFDIPSAIDHEKILEHVALLRKGESVNWTTYGFNFKPEEPFLMLPSNVVIIEGIFLLHLEKLREQLDFSVLIESEQKTILKKRISRDINERGMTNSEVMYQWNNHVLPGYSKYIEPHKEHAHISVFNNHTDHQMIEKVYEAIQSFVIKERKD